MALIVLYVENNWVLHIFMIFYFILNKAKSHAPNLYNSFEDCLTWK